MFRKRFTLVALIAIGVGAFVAGFGFHAYLHGWFLVGQLTAI